MRAVPGCHDHGCIQIIDDLGIPDAPETDEIETVAPRQPESGQQRRQSLAADPVAPAFGRIQRGDDPLKRMDFGTGELQLHCNRVLHGHANQNSFAVREREMRLLFEIVGECMAVVQQPPRRQLEGIFGEQFELHLYRVCDQHRQRLRREGFRSGLAIHEAAAESRGIGNGQDFDRLGQSAGEVPPGESPDEADIADHGFGMVKVAEQILRAFEIDSILAAHGGIDLSQQRGRHQRESHAAPEQRRREVDGIADGAPAHRDQKAVLRELNFREEAEDSFHRIEIFQPFAAFDCQTPLR